ncbi:MAG TPA: hypothetical protein VK971_00455 [Thiohalobacter sp.]|nr:hypothetical protein [Thiohalobacter sp.]
MTQLDENQIEEILRHVMTTAQFKKWPGPELTIGLARAAGAMAGRVAASEEQLMATITGLVYAMSDQAGDAFAARNKNRH